MDQWQFKVVYQLKRNLSDCQINSKSTSVWPGSVLKYISPVHSSIVLEVLWGFLTEVTFKLSFLVVTVANPHDEFEPTAKFA